MLFMPIHFRSRTVGFFVIRNAVYLMAVSYTHLDVYKRQIKNIVGALRLGDKMYTAKK